MSANRLARLKAQQAALRTCTRCRAMTGPPVVGAPVLSPVMLIGQAPGNREIGIGRPFAWTAGRTLFRWLESIGLTEAAVRERVYMAAVCRCFPGKLPKGGDRVPSAAEVQRCSGWLDSEIELVQPELILPVGKLAISRFVEVGRLSEIVGQPLIRVVAGAARQIIALPHPSGASTWHRTDPGKQLLEKALQRLEQHPAWQSLLD
jgi:uracil-DNA glycosylase